MTTTPDIVTRRWLAPDEVAEVQALLAEAAGPGVDPFSDHLRLDLAAGGRPGFVAVLARGAGGQLVAYAQASAANDSTELGVVVDPAHGERYVELVTAVLTPTLAVLRAGDGGTVHWWVHGGDERAATVAGRIGLVLGRQLHQMRRPLPTGLPVEVTTRAFRIGHDEEEWLGVNNRAFADHPEQGGWDLATLRAREAEPWFDADGFRLYPHDGRIEAFCWTKVHDDELPAVGEIYVIAVDPAAHSRGLGRALTLAGLESLADRGITVGMLYVDGTNERALRLYRGLGFTDHQVDHAYLTDG